ncbi:Fc.00g083490.m01.CDS01 [Cosmosporella sp. VM-42]
MDEATEAISPPEPSTLRPMLCSFCEPYLDIPEVVNNGPSIESPPEWARWGRPRTLDSYDGIDCPMCDFFQRILRTLTSANHPYSVSIADASQSLNWASPDLKGTRLLRLESPALEGGKRAELFVYHASGDGPFVPVPRMVDYAWIKKGLVLSGEQHGDDGAGVRHPKIPDLRMIDCSCRKIINWGSLGCTSSYLTLSYLWGKSSACERKFRNRVPAHAPKVIDDAIEVTMNLGYRYLWVDRYCIPSDNLAKHTQLCNMGNIYQNSDLTIIAAVGDDPSTGLPGTGMTPREEQISITIGRHTLCLMPPDVKDEIQRSRWNRRGWTYQEAFLSRRQLVFTKNQVYLQCGEINHQEAIMLPSVRTHQGAIETFDSTVRYSPKNHVGKVFRSLYELGCTKFSWLVNEYAMRELTFETDILHAFKGILQRFESLEPPIENLCGVPLYPPDRHKLTNTGTLVYGLSWNPTPKASLELHTNLRSEVSRRKQFPSWSWTGWQLSPNLEYDFHLWPLSDILSGRGFALNHDVFKPVLHIGVGFPDGSVEPWETERDCILQKYRTGVPIQFLELECWTFTLNMSCLKDIEIRPADYLVEIGPFRVHKQDLATSFFMMEAEKPTTPLKCIILSHFAAFRPKRSEHHSWLYVMSVGKHEGEDLFSRLGVMSLGWGWEPGPDLNNHLLVPPTPAGRLQSNPSPFTPSTTIAMDPLSIAASIAGLLKAAQELGSILGPYISAAKEVPAIASQVHSEVQNSKAIIWAVQNLTQKLGSVPIKNASLIQLDQVITVLTDGVLIFSELEVAVGSLSTSNPSGISGLRLWTRLQWARKEGTFSPLLTRLQGFKISLSLMLTILQCDSDLRAVQHQGELAANIDALLESNQTLSRRLMNLEDVFDAQSIISKRQTIDVNTVQPLRNNEEQPQDQQDLQSQTVSDNAQDQAVSQMKQLSIVPETTTVPSFEFETDLDASRVYRRAKRHSMDYSFRSSTAPSKPSSIFSGFSLDDISIIAFIALPLYPQDIANPQHYDFGDDSQSQKSFTQIAQNPPQNLPQNQASYPKTSIFHDCLVIKAQWLQVPGVSMWKVFEQPRRLNAEPLNPMSELREVCNRGWPLLFLVVKTLKIVMGKLMDSGVVQPVDVTSLLPTRSDDGQELSKAGRIFMEFLGEERAYVLELEELLELKLQIELEGLLSGDQNQRIFELFPRLLHFEIQFLLDLEAIALNPSQQQNWAYPFRFWEHHDGYYVALIARQKEVKKIIKSSLKKPKSSSRRYFVDKCLKLLSVPPSRLAEYESVLKAMFYVDHAELAEYQKEEIQNGLAIVQSALLKVSEAAKAEERNQVFRKLETRMDDWKGVEVSQLGQLLLFEILQTSVDDSVYSSVSLYESLMIVAAHFR